MVATMVAIVMIPKKPMKMKGENFKMKTEGDKKKKKRVVGTIASSAAHFVMRNTNCMLWYTRCQTNARFSRLRGRYDS